MTYEERISVEVFLETHPLKEEKKIMLRYLARVADKTEIIERRKGSSKIECRFDCGAYKGEEIVSFRIKDMSPLLIALTLENLTSGHLFHFGLAHMRVLEQMAERITKSQE